MPITPRSKGFYMVLNLVIVVLAVFGAIFIYNKIQANTSGYLKLNNGQQEKLDDSQIISYIIFKIAGVIGILLLILWSVYRKTRKRMEKFS